MAGMPIGIPAITLAVRAPIGGGSTASGSERARSPRCRPGRPAERPGCCCRERLHRHRTCRWAAASGHPSRHRRCPRGSASESGRPASASASASGRAWVSALASVPRTASATATASASASASGRGVFRRRRRRRVGSGAQPCVMVSVPASPVKVTKVVAWSGSVANHGEVNLYDDDPPPACTHDPACATPLTVSAVGLSPVQIQTVVPAGASSHADLTGQPLPAQPWVAPSAVPASPSDRIRRAEYGGDLGELHRCLRSNVATRRGPRPASGSRRTPIFLVEESSHIWAGHIARMTSNPLRTPQGRQRY